MEDNNKQLEQFFKQSMDRFNESPDDLVWDNISDRLDQDIPWYLLLWNKSKTWLPLFLAILLVAGSWMYQSSEGPESSIEQQTKINTTLLTENSQLKAQQQLNDNNIEHYKKQIASLNSELSTLKKAAKQTADHKSQTSSNNQNTEQLLSTLEQENSNLMRRNLQLEDELLNIKKAIADCNAERSFLLANVAESLKEEKEATETVSDIETEPEKLTLLGYFPWKKTLDKAFTLEIDDPLKNMNFQATKRAKSDKKPNRYRLGASARFFNTYVQNSRQVNPGRSWGLKQEYRVSKRFSLTHMLHYNEQEYTINNNDAPLSEDVLERFPGGLDRENSVVSQVDARSKYIDTNLGIKWNLTPNKKDFNWYINPSAVWQLYLPQEFQFTISQADDIIVTENRYVGSLGSANIEFGTEKKLSNGLRLVLNAYYEQSFIPVGFDHQYVSIAGLGTKLMFGK